jgi:hypothetical protein
MADTPSAHAPNVSPGKIASCPYCGGPAHVSHRVTGTERALFFIPIRRCHACQVRYFDLRLFRIACKVQVGA